MTKLRTRPIGKMRQAAQGRPLRGLTKVRELYLNFIMAPQQWSGPKFARSLISKPNSAGSTDSSQLMTDFTKARRMKLPAGIVDKYRSPSGQA